MTRDPLSRVRHAFAAMADVVERPSHGEPAWFYRDKRQIAMWADHHHDDRVALWCAAPPGVQQALTESEPERYFRPPYVGHRGWIGIDFGADPDWDTVETLVSDAYRLIASKR
ncbi:MAG: MmcQ/YjbR family DNA-binding protein [Armatimonadetes bacterium]|nr:MmcQ/YjbR family DNA-binding protein [Armatimonadota bacterium]